MSEIKYLNEDTLIIKQEDNTLYIQKELDGVRVIDEFLTTDGYEVGTELVFDNVEAKELFKFLKQHHFD